MIHYHGTPITPQSELLTIAGRHYCVSFAAPSQVKICHSLGQSVMLDNGAYSFWNDKNRLHPGWDAYMDWAEPWLDTPTTWAVIPDVIDGDVEANDRLLVEWFVRRMPKGAPVWHLHEPLDRLRRLSAGYERVCLGSSGMYRTPRSVAWRRRVSEAFDVIADEGGRVPYVHMLRGMALSGDIYPFASVDSTDVARNHHLDHNSALKLAARWDAMQCPSRWRRVDQLTMEAYL